jgi:hypothetical protein
MLTLAEDDITLFVFSSFVSSSLRPGKMEAIITFLTVHETKPVPDGLHDT